MIARKDTWSYRASKFVRRNKTGVIAAALVVLALLAESLRLHGRRKLQRRNAPRPNVDSMKSAIWQIRRFLNYTTPLKNFPVRPLRVNYW